MGFFTDRERAELGKPIETRAKAKVRPPVVARRDFAPRPRVAGSNFVADVGFAVERMTERSLHEIDSLILVLKKRRDRLHNESARVQRAVIEYAALSQSTMQSTRIIAESLSHLNKIPDIARVWQGLIEDPAEKAHEEAETEHEDKAEKDGADDGHKDIAAEEYVSAAGAEPIAGEAHEQVVKDEGSGGAADGLAQQNEDADLFDDRTQLTATADGAGPEATVTP
jgi:hypothetical protein